MIRTDRPLPVAWRSQPRLAWKRVSCAMERLVSLVLGRLRFDVGIEFLLALIYFHLGQVP